MFTVSVDHNLEKAIAGMETLASQMPFIMSKALNATAKEIQQTTRAAMPVRFTMRSDWIQKGLRIEPSSKGNLEAVIYSRDRFMDLQEAGGTKTPRRKWLTIPTRAVLRTPKGVVRKSERPAALIARGITEVIEFKGNRWIALKDDKKIKLRGKKGSKNLRLLYLLVPRATLHERLGLHKDAHAVVQAKFGDHMRDAIEYALRTAR